MSNTIASLLDEYITSLRRRELRPATLHAYRGDLVAPAPYRSCSAEFIAAAKFSKACGAPRAIAFTQLTCGALPSS